MVSFLKRVIANPALKSGDYLRVLASSFFHSMGMTGEQVILGYLIFQQTGSTAWVGISLAVYFGPMLIFGVPAGALSDLIDRKRILPAIEGCMVLLLGLFGALLHYGDPGLWALLLLTFSSGSLRAIYNPVRASYVYDIVGREGAVASLGLVNLCSRSGQLLGAIMSGWVLSGMGSGIGFLVLSTGHLISFLGLLGLGTEGRAKDAIPVTLGENLKEYWHEICHNYRLLILIGLTSAVEILGFSFATALPEIATEKLGVGAQGLGHMHSARAAGGIVAGLLFAGALVLQNKGRVYLCVAGGFGCSLIALGLAPFFWLVLLAIAAVAIMAVATDVLSQSMMQMVVPDRLRGRAMGAWVFAIGVAPIGHLEMGFLAESLGADTTLIVNGLLLLGITLCIAVLVPALAKPGKMSI
ncbi:MAG: MFS transporter [Gammaproteobacteria bacterium]|nr:MFS transporter [Gammaproteobacteria bacterium]NKB63586.1 MFS transporter [Gammaproteobacteria bacterium]NKB64523.1 MFS transporter [Gammaproteobacteria bacterium]